MSGQPKWICALRATSVRSARPHRPSRRHQVDRVGEQRCGVGAAEGRAGRLRVGYMDFAINGRLPQILQAFRARHPQVRVDLDYMPTAVQHAALLEGRIDIAFIIGELESPKVLNLLVEQDDFVALLPETHALARQKTLRTADLANQPFVMGSEDTFSSFRARMFSVCHGAGFFPRIVQQASNTSGILGLVAAGVGVTIFAGNIRNLRRAGVVVKPLSDARQIIPTFAAWVVDHPSAVLQRFRDVLIDSFWADCSLMLKRYLQYGFTSADRHTKIPNA